MSPVAASMAQAGQGPGGGVVGGARGGGAGGGVDGGAAVGAAGGRGGGVPVGPGRWLWVEAADPVDQARVHAAGGGQVSPEPVGGGERGLGPADAYVVHEQADEAPFV